jgi:hypothetical protein
LTFVFETGFNICFLTLYPYFSSLTFFFGYGFFTSFFDLGFLSSLCAFVCGVCFLNLIFNVVFTSFFYFGILTLFFCPMFLLLVLNKVY